MRCRAAPSLASWSAQLFPSHSHSVIRPASTLAVDECALTLPTFASSGFVNHLAHTWAARELGLVAYALSRPAVLTVAKQPPFNSKGSSTTPAAMVIQKSSPSLDD